MRVEAPSAGEANPELAASLDALHRDVYANNMAPYWVVDRSVAHDEDRQVAQGRKASQWLIGKAVTKDEAERCCDGNALGPVRRAHIGFSLPDVVPIR